jgi:glycosyltransferase involved in cell wall biosynthesis
MNKMRILMLGESLDRSGGIVSVQKLILGNIPSDVEISCIATLSNTSSVILKILVFIQALGLLFWQLSTKKVDLVHIHVAERGSAFRQAGTTIIAWLFQKPVILHSHSADFHVFYDNLHPIVRFGLRWAFCKSTRFIVLSHSWKKFFVENLGLQSERVIVFPNPVKFPAEIPLRINAKKVNFLFLGKGAFDLIAAFDALPPERKQQAKLIIAGDGEVQKARDTIEKLCLTEYICILDWVNEVQRNELLRNANVFVLPSYNEGLPMALLEAMSWQIPVVSTPVGGIPELITPAKNGLLVNPGDVQELSKAMQSLIDSEDLRISLGNAARETVNPYEVGLYCDRLKNIFIECCDIIDDNKPNQINS